MQCTSWIYVRLIRSYLFRAYSIENGKKEVDHSRRECGLSLLCSQESHTYHNALEIDSCCGGYRQSL